MRTILIVDDSLESSELLKRKLIKRGYHHVIAVSSAEEAFNILNNEGQGSLMIDLILLDVVMPGMDGIEACSIIKMNERLEDIPIIMVTGMDSPKVLEQAFKAGAMDYIKKPYETLELTARIRNALKLKQEIDRRKARELELLEVTGELRELNSVLEQLSNIDGLTGIANRRSFDAYINSEWDRALRSGEPLAIILYDIDKFKLFNDTYGHIEGDDCLKMIAAISTATIRRSSDLIARYGGEEFVAVLPNTPLEGAMMIAEQLRTNIENAKIPNENSTVADVLTVSVGVASLIPTTTTCMAEELINMADQGLYYCKKNGRNKIATIQLRRKEAK